MRNTCILYFFLSDIDGLVREIIVDLNGSDPIVFKSALDNVLLEVGIISKDLPIVFEPWGLYSWYVVVFWCFSSFHEGKIIDGGAHLVEEMFVNILFEILFFFPVESRQQN